MTGKSEYEVRRAEAGAEVTITVDMQAGYEQSALTALEKAAHKMREILSITPR